MFERSAVAGHAFVALESSAPAMVISIPRAQVASKWPMSNTGKEEGTKLVEMIQTIDAAPSGMRVDLVSIRIDGLTTDVARFSWLYEEWGSRVDIRLVFIVPAQIPGPVAVFPARPNGIRYGIFALADVAAAANKSPSATDSSVELVRTIQMVQDNKEESVLLPVPDEVFSFTDSFFGSRDQGYKSLTSWTAGRANFRVCPLTKYDSSVDEDFFRRTRTLQKSEKKQLVKSKVDD